eukprot:3540115-Rhodomonas_salina.1
MLQALSLLAAQRGSVRHLSLPHASSRQPPLALDAGSSQTPLQPQQLHQHQHQGLGASAWREPEENATRTRLRAAEQSPAPTPPHPSRRGSQAPLPRVLLGGTMGRGRSEGPR